VRGGVERACHLGGGLPACLGDGEQRDRHRS
jgi:hypothetical protein